MSRYGGTLAAVAVAGLLAASALPSDAAARRHVAHARTSSFDGLWSVSIRTQSGPCDPAYRYPARIVRGVVVQADNDFSYQITGVVVSSGFIEVTVSRGGQSATGRGRLNGARGGGRWSTSGGQCFGMWSASRRG